MSRNRIVYARVIAVIAIGIGAAFISGVLSPLVAQDRLTLLKQVRKSRIGPTELFQGSAVRCKTFIQRDTSQPREILCEIDFSSLSPDVWRCNSTERGELTSYVRNGDFAFEVVKNSTPGESSDSARYTWARLGFERAIHLGIADSTFTRFQLIQIPTHVFSVDLVDFLQLQNVTIENISSTHSRIGLEAQKVEWTMKANPPEYPFDSYGSYIWLHEHGFLLESSEFYFGIRSSEGSNKGFQFECIFELNADGKLRPVKTNRIEPNGSYTCELGDVTEAVQDKIYYTAEWFGLETPGNPRRFNVIWWTLGIIFLILATSPFWKKLRR